MERKTKSTLSLIFLGLGLIMPIEVIVLGGNGILPLAAIIVMIVLSFGFIVAGVALATSSRSDQPSEPKSKKEKSPKQKKIKKPFISEKEWDELDEEEEEIEMMEDD